MHVHTTDGSLFSPARAVGVAGALALTVDGTIFEPNDQNRKTFFAAFCFLVNEFRGRKTSASRVQVGILPLLPFCRYMLFS
ncbi:MAG: hypothetical protein DMG97_36650 [Acidobacteria bacterium]|nr:MAG: hypothetical protein DMG97_36650 [Acidobacteriota bacterium]